MRNFKSDGLYCGWLQADVEASVYHTARLVSTAALDLMTTQRDLIYTARAETRLKIHPKDKAALGITVARLVEDGGPPTKVKTLLGHIDVITLRHQITLGRANLLHGI